MTTSQGLSPRMRTAIGVGGAASGQRRNFEDVVAFAVEAEVSVLSGPAYLSGINLVFGNISAGAEVESTAPVSVTLNDDAQDGDMVKLLVTATDGVEVWTSILSEAVIAADAYKRVYYFKSLESLEKANEQLAAKEKSKQ